jgi:diacylglycerol kinase (ATP)
MRVGVVHNPRSHGNRGGRGKAVDGVLWAQPATAKALAETLAQFAAARIELLVVDGGDGTVRDVLSALPAAFGAAPPLLAVLPSGKTNMLAIDLGAPKDWRLEDAMNAAARNAPKVRAPLEVRWRDEARTPLHGFFFGVGGFVRATQMAQTVHRWGAFHNLAVAVTLAGAVWQTLAGGADNPWRRGVELSADADGEPLPAGRRFVFMATGLKRLPFGVRPFGPVREGLKHLDVDAPPRGLFAALPMVLSGRAGERLERGGYRRGEARTLTLSTPESFVFDGEIYPGGDITVSLGPPLRFVAAT